MYVLSQQVVTLAIRSVAVVFNVCHNSYHSILTLVRPQVAVPDLVDASCDADILVFVIPHQFVGKVCDTMKGKIKSDALGISLIKVQLCSFYAAIL